MFLMTSLFEGRVLTFASIKSERTRNFPTFQVHCQTGSFYQRASSRWINGTEVVLFFFLTYFRKRLTFLELLLSKTNSFLSTLSLFLLFCRK